MGLFSWCTSDTRKSIAVDMEGYEDCPKKVYLLNPFGEPYEETAYDGYGNFGGEDVYALVAKWNIPEKCKDENGNWLPDDIIRNYGIDIACYNNDHVKLEYPIKIVEHPCAYNDADISPNCPFQGYFYPADEEDYDEEYNENHYACDISAAEKIQREIDGVFDDLDNAIENWQLLQYGVVSYDDYLNKRMQCHDTEYFDRMVVKLVSTPEDVLKKIAETSNIFVDQDMMDNENISNEMLHILKDKYMNKEGYLRKVEMIMEHPNYVYDSIESLIFWGVNDATGKLTISDHPVHGTASSAFARTSIFTYDDEEEKIDTPWHEYTDIITSIEVQGHVAPISTNLWFADLYKVETIDVSKLDTSNVIDMSWMFDGTGLDITDSFTITGMENWDVSNVVNMSFMFAFAGKNATTFDIGDISNWNTSNVTDMSYMFECTGEEAPTFNIGDISNWNISKVIDMSHMFKYAGKNATTWNIGDISNWDTDKVENTENMFDYVHNMTTIKEEARQNSNKLDKVIANINENAEAKAPDKERSNEKHVGFEKIDKGDDAR